MTPETINAASREAERQTEVEAELRVCRYLEIKDYRDEIARLKGEVDTWRARSEMLCGMIMAVGVGLVGWPQMFGDFQQKLSEWQDADASSSSQGGAGPLGHPAPVSPSMPETPAQPRKD